MTIEGGNMGRYNERKCIYCEFTTRKRKHLSCPFCGGNLEPILLQNEKSNLTPEQIATSNLIPDSELLA